MYKLNSEIINNLSEKAKVSERKRINLNIHQQSNDPIQRFLNAMEPGTYIRPHKHDNPAKRELFAVVKGKFAIIEFDNLGNITDYAILSQNSDNYAVEIEPESYHTVIALEKSSIALEIKDGPYNPENDKNFASWAPPESDKNNATEFLNKIIEKLNLKNM